MAGGIALIGVGGYFLLLRPVLLPEDDRGSGPRAVEVASEHLYRARESRALQSKKRDFIEHVVAAINQAIVARS
jgi:hypothetical protein